MEKNNTRESMIFYNSFYKSIRKLSRKIKVSLYDSIFDYSFAFTEPNFSEDSVEFTVWTLIKPQLDANRKKYLNGCKAKNQENGSKEEANGEQTGSKQLTNDNQECIIGNEELEINNENTKVRKIIIDNAMAMSFYKKQWSFIPDGLREQDYKLSVYDVLVEWILHNQKQDDVKFIQVSLQQVEEIYKSTSNNPEAVANIKNCIESNKPMLIPDSMRSAIKQIQEKNKPLTDINEINKKFEGVCQNFCVNTILHFPKFNQ